MSFCCRLPVEVTLEDLVRLGLVTEGTPAERKSSKKIARELIKAGKVSQYRVSLDLFQLAQRPDGDCVYLHAQKRVCTVYEQRPTVCRRFPEIGPRPGFCPSQRKPN